jgi:hypothetical protein
VIKNKKHGFVEDQKQRAKNKKDDTTPSKVSRLNNMKHVVIAIGVAMLVLVGAVITLGTLYGMCRKSKLVESVLGSCKNEAGEAIECGTGFGQVTCDCKTGSPVIKTIPCKANKTCAWSVKTSAI